MTPPPTPESWTPPPSFARAVRRTSVRLYTRQRISTASPVSSLSEYTDACSYLSDQDSSLPSRFPSHQVGLQQEIEGSFEVHEGLFRRLQGARRPSFSDATCSNDGMDSSVFEISSDVESREGPEGTNSTAAEATSDDDSVEALSESTHNSEKQPRPIPSDVTSSSQYDGDQTEPDEDSECVQIALAMSPSAEPTEPPSSECRSQEAVDKSEGNGVFFASF